VVSRRAGSPARLGIRQGATVREVFVPTATDDGSAFADHLVLIWTVGGHTYGIGFHDLHGICATLGLDVALARDIELVG
jgi:hypothetical protein